MLREHNRNLGLYLHLTTDCNLRCRYCYSGEKTRGRMTPEVGRAAVDFYLARTDRLNLRFFGGEPLLELALIKELVEYAKDRARNGKKRLDLVIVTNGVLFTEEVAEFCRLHRIEYSLSFDGCRQAQDANRLFPSGAGSFAAVEKNIPHMVRRNPYVHVVTVVGPNNVLFLTDSVRYLLERGIRNISLSPDYTHADFLESLPVMEQEYLKVAEIYLETLKSGQKIFINALDRPETGFNRGRCKLGEEDFSVDISGGIYPCCCFVDQKLYPLGDIYGGIDPEKAEIFMEDLRRLDRHIMEAHRDCPETSFCRKGCGCTNIVTSGRLDSVDPKLCMYGRMEAKVRDYVNSRLGSGS